jgi:hypothetical protein
MSTFGFIQFMTREQLVEKYGIPRDLEDEIFLVLHPVTGSGANARYLESVVDQQLHKYFVEKCRPKFPASWSLEKEDRTMKRAEASWASTVEDESQPAISVAEPLLVDEETAAQLLGVSKRTVFDLEERGILKSIRIGKKIKRYSVSHLREFAEGKVA